MTREEQIKDMIRGCLRSAASELRGFRVVLFGSRAAGTARERSDFDVGVLGSEPVPLSTFYRLQDRLEDLPTLFQIDWVDLNRVSPEFRRQALARTETLLEA